MILRAVTDVEIRARQLWAHASRKADGAVLVEYGLLITLVAIALVAAVIFFSGGLGRTYNKAGSCLSVVA